MQLIQSGKLRFLGVAGMRRHGGALATVPTMREQGVDVIANVFYTVFGPQGLTAAQTTFWDEALTNAIKSDTVRKELDFNFWTVDTIGSRELPAFLEREMAAYRKALTALGMAK